MDPYLVDILEECLDNITTKHSLDQSWSTWSRMKGAGGIVSFNDFVFGTLNGSMVSLYSSFHGKNVTELTDEEFEGLRELLIHRYEGLEKQITRFQKNKST
jgi:hypothetical protein